MPARKGVVIEKGKGWAIIMLPDGKFKRIKTSQYLEVGEQYQETNFLPVKYVAAAVILLTMLLASIDYYSVKAYAQVSSLVELGVNRWGRVVAIKATDNQGQRILLEVEVKNDELEVAVEKIYLQALNDKQSSRLLPSKSNLSIKSTKQTQPQLEKKLLKKMDRGLQKAKQNQKHKDEIKDSFKNKVQPKADKSQAIIIPNENQKWPSEKDFAKVVFGEQIKDVDNQIDSVESKIKNHCGKIDPTKQPNDHKINSELKNDNANKKDNLKQKDSPSDKHNNHK